MSMKRDYAVCVNFMNKNYCLTYLLILAFLSIILLHRFNVNGYIEKITVVELENNPVKEFNKCFYSNINVDEDTLTITDKLDKCIEKLPKIEILKTRKNIYDESKVILPLKGDYNESECFWLTVGIGQTTVVEKQFHEKYPECKMFGIESSEDQFGDFSSFGTVIPFAVGTKPGKFNITIRTKSHYAKKTYTIHPITELLDKHVGQRLIHYLSIDLEGFEFPILEELLPHGKLYKQGVTFCVVDAELHQFNDDYKLRLKQLLINMHQVNSDYFPIYHSLYHKRHHKITFINIGNSECSKAFDLSIISNRFYQ